MDGDGLWRGVHRMEAAADKAQQAARAMESAAQRITQLLENGYGGNGLRLIELLEQARIEGEHA